jgi:eukaryotic-like serine/threonine-protein kinase
VWLAYDEQLDAEVAVKVLADNWAHDDAVRRRFLEEGRFLRRVESEHVVQVHDVGEMEDGRPFLVLTYADRGTLADRLKEEPLALEVAIGVIVQVGRGLQALHRRGLLHRDVKPANVLFRSTDEGERAVLSDLGLGKSLDEASRITMPGGTPSYVAPEQAMGERLDQRADLYALGAVAYAALTGRSPHQLDGLGAAGRVAAPPPPSSLGFAVPDRVDAAIVRALDPDREKRWADVESFTRELVGALDETTHNFMPAEVAARAAATEAAGQVDDPTVNAEPPTVAALTAPPAEATAQPETVAEAESPAEEKRPRRRGRWVVAAVLALIIGAGAGFGAQRYLAPQLDVDVTQGGFMLRIPRGWAGSIAESTWVPPGSSIDRSALRVSKDEGWNSPGTGTPGVFVGVMARDGELAKKLPGGERYGCTSTEPVTKTSRGDLTVLDQYSTGCGNDRSTLLQRVAELDVARAVLIQVQVPASDRDRALEVAASVRYSVGGTP